MCGIVNLFSVTLFHVVSSKTSILDLTQVRSYSYKMSPTSHIIVIALMLIGRVVWAQDDGSGGEASSSEFVAHICVLHRNNIKAVAIFMGTVPFDLNHELLIPFCMIL